jgi:DNA-binding NtrC family response regulator
MTMKSILVMDDEMCVLESIRMILGDRYNVYLADNQYAAERILEDHKVDLITLEPLMAALDRSRFFRYLSEKHGDAKVIYVSSYGPDEFIHQPELIGISRYIPKPFDCSFVLNAVSEALSS